MNILISSDTFVKERIKMPVMAGMEFCNGKIINYKMRKVGYDIFEHTYKVYLYDDGYKDLEQIASKKIKRVFYK